MPAWLPPRGQPAAVGASVPLPVLAYPPGTVLAGPVAMDYLSEYERVSARLVRELDEVDPERVVPACPGWTVADLALHIGGGERWAASILLSGREQHRPEVLRSAISWADWYQATSAALAAAIRAVDPAEPCWNFAPVEQRAAFWSRRRAHEALVHLADVRQAAGGVEAGREVIPPELGADGVDEVFSVFLPRMLARGAEPAVTRPISFSTTDTSDQWTLIPPDAAKPVAPGQDEAPGLPTGGQGSGDPGSSRPGTPATAPAVRTGEVTGEAVLSGTAADLLLVLWKRLPADRLTVGGDPAVANAFLAATSTP